MSDNEPRDPGAAHFQARMDAAPELDELPERAFPGDMAKHAGELWVYCGAGHGWWRANDDPVWGI